MRPDRRRWLVLASRMAFVLPGLASRPARAQRATLEVLEVRYRDAEELLPVLRPFVEPGGTITVLRNQLVVRTGPANLAELRRILAELDRRPRQLRVQVTQDAVRAGRENPMRLRGGVSGSRAEVLAPGGPPDGAGNAAAAPGVDVRSSESLSADRGTQAVLVLEGQTAFLSVSESRAVRSTGVIATPAGPRVGESVRYREAASGFSVRPRVQGSRVTVEIQAGRARLPEAGDAASVTRSVSTVVSGALGEWIEIGGASAARAEADDAVTYRSTDAGRDVAVWYLRVDEVTPAGAR